MTRIEAYREAMYARKAARAGMTLTEFKAHLRAELLKPFLTSREWIAVRIVERGNLHVTITAVQQ